MFCCFSWEKSTKCSQNPGLVNEFSATPRGRLNWTGPIANGSDFFGSPWRAENREINPRGSCRGSSRGRSRGRTRGSTRGATRGSRFAFACSVRCPYTYECRTTLCNYHRMISDFLWSWVRGHPRVVSIQEWLLVGPTHTSLLRKAKPGGFQTGGVATFFGKVQIVSRTLSGLFLLGAVNTLFFHSWFFCFFLVFWGEKGRNFFERWGNEPFEAKKNQEKFPKGQESWFLSQFLQDSATQKFQDF